MGRLVVIVVLVAATVYGRHEKYEGHQLYRVTGPTQEFGYLKAKLDLLSSQFIDQTELKLSEGLLRLSPEHKDQWLHYFSTKNMTYMKTADNLAEVFREEESKILSAKLAAKRSGRSMSWDTYYNHDEINNYLDELGVRYPNLVTVVNATRTTEGRLLKYVRISSTQFTDLTKPLVIIDAAMHAREWITIPLALFIINQLVVDNVERQLTDRIDWIIIPVANPDGYQYSMDEDRLWRKTRSRSHPNAAACPGVDSNRNFDHFWGTFWQNEDPCSNTYEGPFPFSEPETRLVRDLLIQQRIRIAMYISLHNYGTMILFPWGNVVTHPPNIRGLEFTAMNMAQAMNPLGRPYVIGGANIRPLTSGTARDWMYSAGIPFSFTFELPAYGALNNGWEVPPEFIELIVRETWPAIAAGTRPLLLWPASGSS